MLEVELNKSIGAICFKKETPIAIRQGQGIDQPLHCEIAVDEVTLGLE